MPALRIDTERDFERQYGNLLPIATSDEADALDAFARANADPDERKVLWRALAAYEHTPNYEEFVRRLRLIDGPEAESFYATVHWCYLVGWRVYGFDELQRMIRIGWSGLHTSNWRLE